MSKRGKAGALGPAPPICLTAAGINERRKVQRHAPYTNNIISMPSTATASTMYLTETLSSLNALPDELLLHILGHLDYPFLLALSRVRDLGLCCGFC